MLNRAEILAVREYFDLEILPHLQAAAPTSLNEREHFTISSALLMKLIQESEIIDIEADAVPFSHKMADTLMILGGQAIGGDNFY